MQPLSRFIAASGAANLADGVAVVAWAWVASLLTRDALLIALVPVALRLPWFLLALPAGVVTDRVDRRRLILRMDLMRAVAVAGVAAMLALSVPLKPAPEAGLAHPLVFAGLCLAALIVGGAEVFRDNAAQTMLPALVPHAGLERANGRLWSVELLANALIGPALGAVLIGLWLPLPFALNAAAFAMAVLLVSGLRGRFAPERAAVRSWRAELAEGFAFLRGAPLLRALALTTGGWNLLHQITAVAMVLHVQENLHMGSEAYGFALAGGAAGGILGSLIGPRVAAALGPGRTLQWMLAASAPAFVAMALAPGPFALAAALGFMELTGMIWNIVSVSLRQRMIPDALLGRVNSLYRLLAWGMIPLGLILSGLIVRGAETAMPRDAALLVPFWGATAGAVLLTVCAWRAIARGH